MIVTINCGSSSIKFTLFPADGELQRSTILCEGQIDGIGEEPRLIAVDAAGNQFADERLETGATHEEALEFLRCSLERRFPGRRLVAAGHRVVHGGTKYNTPVIVDEDVLADLEELVSLAPLHEPHNIAAIKAVAKLEPTIPQVACFDTAFHCTQPPVATLFAIPRQLTKAGIRRYGFHGLSYEYIASVLPDYAGSSSDGKVVVAHLGQGASMCAMEARRSVATTMGFTAIDGLPMGRRCGSLDAGVVLYLMAEKGMNVAAVTDLLYNHSGLLGVSGISGDMRTLSASSDPHAAEAIELFVYRIERELGSLVAVLGGLDVLVFTGGIGEHSTAVREQVCKRASWLGIELDPCANVAGGPRITTATSHVSAWVIPTDEDLVIARHTVKLLAVANRTVLPVNNTHGAPEIMRNLL
jgi:acetate kinase